jgi:hypothetical protein
MNFKTTYLLFGILVAMLVALLLTQLRGKKPTDTTDYVLPVLQASKLTAQDITGVEIDRLRPKAEKLVFARTSDGWELEQPKSRADHSLIDQLIGQVMRASKEESADMTAAPSQYGLDEPSATITLRSGEREWTLSIGNASTGKDEAVVYVTSSDRPNESFAVRRMQIDSIIKEIDAKGAIEYKPTNDFRSKYLLAESAFDINGVTLEQPKRETIALDKTKEGKWRFEKPAYGDAEYEGEAAATPPGSTEPKPAGGVKGLLDAIADLRIDADSDFGTTNAADKELAEKGLEKGKETLRVEVKRQPPFGAGGDKKEPVQVGLLIGNKADDKGEKLYARPENERNIVKVAAKKVDAITKVLADPSVLRNHDLTQIESAKVDAIDLDAGSMLKLRKTGEPAEWKIYESGKEQKAEDSSVQDLLTALTAKHTIKEFADAKKSDADLGFDKPSSVVSVWQEGIKKEEKKEEKKDDKAEDKSKDEKKAEAKGAKDNKSDTAKKDAKKDANAEPSLKDEKPTVKLTFGKKDKDLVYVKREAGSDVTRVAVSASLLDKAAGGKLAFLDRHIPSFTSSKDITKIVVVRGNETYEVDRGKEDKWTLQQPKNLAGRSVDPGKAMSVLSALQILRAEKLLAEKPADGDLGRYGLKSPAVKVSVTETKADKKPPDTHVFTFLFGNESEDKSSVYAKLADRDTVFMVRKSVVDAVQGELRDTAVFNFDVNKVKGIKIAGWQDIIGSPFVLEVERKTSQDWAVKSPPNYILNSAQVEGFVSSLAQLHADHFVGVKSGQKPEQKLELKDGAMDIIITVDGEKEPLRLIVGGPSGTEGYYATSNKLPGEVFVLPKGKFAEAKSKPAYFKKEQ